MQEKAREQRDHILRQREEIEASRRALWARMDRLRAAADAAAPDAGRAWLPVPPLAFGTADAIDEGSRFRGRSVRPPPR